MTKPTVSKTLDLSKVDLGELDAGVDEHFLEYAIHLPIIDGIKARDKFFLVGPKGSGKTGIRLKLSKELTPDRVITLSETEGFDFSDLSTNAPNEIKKKIEAYIIGLIYQWMCENTKFNRAEFKSYADMPFFKILRTVADATKLSVPFVTVALGEIFPREKKSSVTALLSSDFTDRMLHAMKDAPLFILIDDIDLFVSTEGVERRVALVQFLYAIFDLNLRVFRKSGVWVVAFLKRELFKEIEKYATEMDKMDTYVQNVTWSSQNLKLAVQNRIEWNIERQGLKTSEYPWTQIFSESSGKEVNRFFVRLTSMAVNGPRNAFSLMKKCLANAVENGNEGLSEKNIDDVALQYGRVVLTNLAAFFQHVYPDVDDLIDIVFRGFKSEFKRNELEEQIRKEFLFIAENKAEFSWAARWTAYKLVEVFYEVGVIGVMQSSSKEFVYSFVEPAARLGSDDKLHVHPGLRAFLATR